MPMDHCSALAIACASGTVPRTAIKEIIYRLESNEEIEEWMRRGTQAAEDETAVEDDLHMAAQLAVADALNKHPTSVSLPRTVERRWRKKALYRELLPAFSQPFSTEVYGPLRTDDLEDNARKLHAPISSCAEPQYRVLALVSVLLDVGRLYCDQLPASEFVRLPSAAYTFRFPVTSLHRGDTVDQLLDRTAKGLSGALPNASIGGALETCCKGTAQFSFNTTRAWACPKRHALFLARRAPRNERETADGTGDTDAPVSSSSQEPETATEPPDPVSEDSEGSMHNENGAEQANIDEAEGVRPPKVPAPKRTRCVLGPRPEMAEMRRAPSVESQLERLLREWFAPYSALDTILPPQCRRCSSHDEGSTPLFSIELVLDRLPYRLVLTDEFHPRELASSRLRELRVHYRRPDNKLRQCRYRPLLCIFQHASRTNNFYLTFHSGDEIYLYDTLQTVRQMRLIRPAKLDKLWDTILSRVYERISDGPCTE